VADVLFGAATVPVFSAIAAYLLAGETTGRATWITIAMVLVGIGIAVFSDGSNGVGLNVTSLIGASAGLGVAMAFAISFVTLRIHRSLAILPTLVGHVKPPDPGRCNRSSHWKFSFNKIPSP
jgi:drug/metabolite transporter (DMT)-like permease